MSDLSIIEIRDKGSQWYKFILIAVVVFFQFSCSQHQVNYDVQPRLIPHQNDHQQNNFQALLNDHADQLQNKHASIEGHSWWQHFHRSQLDKLINTAFSQNLHLKQAITRLKQAETITTQTKSRLFPEINLELETDNEWQGTDSQRGSAYLGATIDWEVDFFKRLDARVQADKARALARFEAIQVLKLTLSADIADNYFNAVAEQQRLSLLNAQLKNDQTLLDLLELRFKKGVGTKVEVLQQQSRVLDSHSLIPVAEGNLLTFENRLDVLLGELPDGKSRIANYENLTMNQPLPVVGLPIDLLMNRPDLKVARAELIAADAEIGVAIADRLPSLTIDSTYSYTDGPNYQGILLSLTNTFVQPLLDWGRRKAVVNQNKAIYEEQLYAFSQLYLEAVESVELALIQQASLQEFITRLEDRSIILNETVKETEARYTQGVDDYLPVLNALQELRALERNIIDQNLLLIKSRISLFRAIGGELYKSS